MKDNKTNAMRILENLNIPYRALTYRLPEDVPFSAAAVAEHLGTDPDQCFKSLCAVGPDKHFYLFVIPSRENLDLKKAARACGEKHVSLAPTKDLKGITGYERGSVTPVGLKKPYPVFIDETATLFEYIEVSGGAKGVSIDVNTDDLARAVNATFVDLVM